MGDRVDCLLNDTHVLVLMDDKALREKMTQLFRSMGATVHHAENQQAAVGMYWRLFKDGIRPRAVVTCWWLDKANAPRRDWLRLIKREEIDGTALDLFRNIVDLDPTAFLSVYTHDPESARNTLQRYGIQAEVVSQYEMSSTAFAARVATHEGICRQRMTPEIVEHELRQIDRRVESGLHPALRTPFPKAYIA
jgi:CheY-like chemotaxis protein